jgi:hypothetical protein
MTPGAPSLSPQPISAMGVSDIFNHNFAAGDRIDLSQVVTSGAHSDDEVVRLQQSGADILVSVDAGGAANGHHFVDVAVLHGLTATDVVRIAFDGKDHTLNVTARAPLRRRKSRQSACTAPRARAVHPG